MSEEYSRLSSIIRNIVSKNSFSEADAERAAEDIKLYYDAGNLNLYSETYRWLSDSNTNEEDFEYLVSRLDLVEKYFSLEDSEKKEKFIKLKDYIILEALRASDFSDIRRIADIAKQQVIEVKKIQEEFEESRKASHTQSITVLSIFTGIAMAFFGGFSLLGSAFERLGQSGVVFSELVMLILIVGLILFNTVYLLLYCASKINKNVLVSSKHLNCDKCAYKPPCKENFWKRKFNFIWRYPLASGINIVMILIIVVLLICRIYNVI